MMSLQNWIKKLGHPKIELKCDQEPSTIDVRNELINICKSTQLVPFATPKGSKGSLGAGERAHLTIGGIARSIKATLENRIEKHRQSDLGNQCRDRLSSSWVLSMFSFLGSLGMQHFALTVFRSRPMGRLPTFLNVAKIIMVKGFRLGE